MPGFPNDQSNPAGAIPVYVVAGGGGGGLTINDVSQTIPAAIPVEVLPANSSRKYLFIQCTTAGNPIWVNIAGRDASTASSSFLLAAGQTYESGTYVSGEAVSIYTEVEADVTVMEG